MIYSKLVITNKHNILDIIQSAIDSCHWLDQMCAEENVDIPQL